MATKTLTRAHRELFRRAPDESFQSFDSLWNHVQGCKERSRELWEQPERIRPTADGDGLRLRVADAEPLRLNAWSFSQLCGLAGVNRDTVNRLTPDTAKRVFDDTLPSQGKPLQVLALDGVVRSVHGASYTRLHNVELLSVVREFATDFGPPQPATGGDTETAGRTGLYCGEQDMFCFLIDPTGWTDIGNEVYAPGFFLWNSEVGRRSVGIQTFWFQAICRNHIVWDAVEVIQFSRKHTANVGEALAEIRGLIHRLVKRRDERRDAFFKVMRNAMSIALGGNAEEVLKVLVNRGIGRVLAKKALESAGRSGHFTIYSVVDALTRQASEIANAADRTEADQAASSLLSLAAV